MEKIFMLLHSVIYIPLITLVTDIGKYVKSKLERIFPLDLYMDLNSKALILTMAATT
jgi:hypothetical protein